MESQLDAILKAIEDSMNSGELVDPESGIVRVSWTTLDEVAEAREEYIGEADSVVSPNTDRSQDLRLGFALSAVGALLLVVVASVYRRKKRMHENDATTVDGLTLNGLSRFDVPLTPHADPIADPISDTVEPRTLTLASISPSTRSVLGSPYTKVQTTEDEMIDEPID